MCVKANAWRFVGASICTTEKGVCLQMKRKKSGIDWKKCPKCGSPLKITLRYTGCKNRTCSYIEDEKAKTNTAPTIAGRHLVRLAEED